MNTKAELVRRLTQALAPSVLEVADESAKHRGHAGYVEGVQTHFRVRVRSKALDGLSRVDRQRAVYAAIGDLMGNPIHALALDARGENED